MPNTDIFTGPGRLSATATSANGAFVIASATYENIYFQRYDQSGSPLGSIVRPNSDPVIDEEQDLYFGALGYFRPAIAMDSDGGFVVCWTVGRVNLFDLGYAAQGIYMRRYTADGVALGDGELVG